MGEVQGPRPLAQTQGPWGSACQQCTMLASQEIGRYERVVTDARLLAGWLAALSN